MMGTRAQEAAEAPPHNPYKTDPRPHDREYDELECLRSCGVIGVLLLSKTS
jgi:hypothetical protein